jgi:hypothetical protein
MNILQFKPLNLEFICKRYEINKFWNSKYKIRPISMIKIKSRARTQDCGLFSEKQRVSLTKRPCEGVRVALNHPITDGRPRLDLSETGGPGESATGEQRADQLGLASGAHATDGWDPRAGRARVKQYPEIWTIGLGMNG